jgi:hypothetical protein
MKQLIIALAILFGVSFTAQADTATDQSLEARVEALENKMPSLPNGLFINGEIEMYYDEDTYSSNWDSRAEVITGLQTDIDAGAINWAGGSARFDSHYSLDTTLNNTIVEKQMGLGVGNNTRLYIGETDAQRLGFAKTPKIGVPLIITESNSRIDHNEKVVLTFGGWDNNNEFDFDTHSMNRDLPIGASIGYDANTEKLYAGATVSLMGLAEVSYMQIGDKDGITDWDNNQQGYAIGTSLYRWDIPVVLGVEMWDDKNTGTYTKEDRMDYGVMYGLTDEVQLGFHRVENDDLGTNGDYLSAVYTQGPVEMGVYYHMTESQNLGTGVITENDDSMKASIKYKF